MQVPNLPDWLDEFLWGMAVLVAGVIVSACLNLH